MIRLVSTNADDATLTAPKIKADRHELSKLSFSIYLLNKTPEKIATFSKYLMQSVHCDDVSTPMQITIKKNLKLTFDNVIH